MQTDEAERDRQLAEELELLHRERAEIIAGSNRDAVRSMRRLDDQLRRRLQLASAYREYQLANLCAAFDSERQHAWNEYEHGKRDLRSQICTMSVDRRKRLEAIRLGVAKRRKRARPGGDRAIRVSTPGRPNFLASLEGQGMVRVALTPDEVNSDIAVILQGLDSVRTNGAARPAAERPTDIVGRNADKIHSSRGTLHYHDISYEKADKVSIFACNKPNTPKYSGTIMSVNSKEIHICASDNQPHRVYVSNLRNGRLLIKPMAT